MQKIGEENDSSVYGFVGGEKSRHKDEQRSCERIIQFLDNRAK